MSKNRHETEVQKRRVPELLPEEVLLKTGALQTAIFNSANFSSIATDAKGVIQIFNVGAERMLGYTAADVMNKITPADISDPQEVIVRAKSLSVEIGTPITPGFEALVFKASRGIEDIYELTYIRKDGSRFPAVVSVTALRDAQKAIIGYLLIGTDNTARKQAEEALLKAGALQRAIFNSANFSSIATDAKGVIQIFNVGAERMLGYAAADVMNKITPADISDPQELIARAKALSVELGTPITPGFEALVFKASRGIEDIYELTYIRKDGSRFPAVVSVTALRDAQDAIIGYLLIGTDNSARKRVEEQLRWTEESFRLMVESVTDCAIVMLDPEGRVVSWNSGAQRIKGYTAEEIVGRHFALFYPREDIERGMPQRALEVVTTRGRFEDEGWRVRKDGSTFWANVVFTAIRDHNGNLRGFAKLTRDLTERKKVEAELTNAKSAAEKARESAEIANKAKSAFLANMSHEIRTPMNAILGFSQLMMRDAGLTLVQKKHLQIVNRSGEHLLALINDILEISKIEAGRLSLNPAAFDLDAMLDEIETIYRMRTGEKSMCFLVERIGDLPGCVVGDENKLRQVFVNLIGNALKFTRKGGISIRVGVKTRSGPAIRLMVEVEDTGSGISEEEIGKLFIPFEQTASGKRMQTGTGLGLAICREIVRLMGGDISVSSQLGKGSIFRFEVNLKEGREEAMAKKVESRFVAGLQPGQAARRVLVVDDKEDNRVLLVQMLGRIGFDVRAAENGEKGVQAFEDWHPHLILMDTRMPVMNGFEAIKRIRSCADGKEVKIISVTASAFDEDRKDAIEIGADDFLGKPFREEVLLEKIKGVLAVDYIYTEASPVLKPEKEVVSEELKEKVAALPKTLIDQFHDAALTADLDRMLDLVHQIERYDADISVKMQSLAEAFEYEKLLEMTTRMKME
jgi:PAS domain S-box-containing protein